MLQRVDPVQLVLGISDERAHRVDLRLDRVDLGAARELIAELALDIGEDAVESVDTSFDLLHELQPGRHAVQLTVELARQLAHAGGLLRALFDEAELGLDGVHLRLDLGHARVQQRDALDEALERHAIGAELVAQLRSFGVRLVELDDLLLQPLEIAPALIERHELRIGALGQLVHLFEPGMQGLERFLFLVELVALREQLLVSLRERVDALVQLRDVLVFRGERFHAPFGFADRCLQHAQPLIEDFEFLLLDREPVDVPANRIVQRVPILLDARNLARELVLRLGGRVELADGFARQLLHAREVLFGARDLLVAFVQLGNLRVHRPDELVQSIGFDDGMVDCVLLALERFGLVRDVLGQRVERREALFGVLAELVQLCERAHALFDVLHRFHRRAAVFARLARHLADAGVVLAEDSGGGAHLLEIGLQRAGGIERILEIALRLPQLRSQIFEGRALLLQRVEAGLRLERLR